ncbi:hypothetical protein B0H13DRAFT_2500981 [Mycena leptocephala]|nr:hypothetical protein B0H13DRAFT_2500981 [Mycena leptocephala]
MLDPITFTTTLLTLGNFIQELIEVGQSIKHSIEKVGENRRRIRDLTNDVIRTLADLASLTRMHEDTFQAPALLSALENLKAGPPWQAGLRRVSHRIKLWVKRDELEKKIGLLKEHVNQCYFQFTAFAAARIEHATLRAEQTLVVNNVENQVKLQRLEGMMARVLLETQFGQNVMNQTFEIISADPKHSTLESQYLSAQTMRLIDCLQQLLRSGSLTLGTSFYDHTTPLSLVFMESSSPSHVLHRILATVLEIQERPAGVHMECFSGIITELGVHLVHLGMTSEAIAWELVVIQILRHFSGSDYFAILPSLAHSLRFLSWQYQNQLQYQPALQASKNPLISGAMIRVLDRRRPIQAVESRKAFFVLAETLSSVHRHLESYEALKEGFQTSLRLPVFLYPPSGSDIDSFLDQACKVAEGGSFPLVMLADCVILFRNLARQYPEQTSSEFLWLLHAYVYYSQQDNPVIKDIRVFLEPNSDSPPPQLDITVHIDDFNEHGEVVTNSWLDPSFNAATIILALPSILDVIPFISNSEQLVLLKTISKTINRFGRILDELQCLEDLPHHTIYSIFRALWTVGLLDDALAVCGQKIGYSKTVNNLLDRAFLLCDMGRIPEAIQAVQEMQSNVPDSLGAAVATEANFLPCIIQMRILRCTGRNQEAHRLLLEVNQKYCAVDSNLFDFEFCFLFTELAASWGHIGIREKSLKIAEKAVAACRRDFNDNEVERGKFALIHSLTTLSNCLAETEMKEAALAAAHEAAMIYTENATHPDQALINAEKATELYRELGALAPRHLPALASSLQNLASALWNVGSREKSIVVDGEATSIMRRVSDDEIVLFSDLKIDLKDEEILTEDITNSQEAIDSEAKGAHLPSACQLLLLQNFLSQQTFPILFSGWVGAMVNTHHK